MIIRLEELQKICSTILTAVDSSELSAITETVELKTVGTFLMMNVTNKEYFVSAKINIKENIDFHATVNAKLFLKLISQITTETVELTVSDTNMLIKGNGRYKLPLIYEGESLLKLPEISINNVTNEFDVSSDIFGSILTYNSKELLKETNVRPICRMYYVDDMGAITFNTGACINKFTLPEKVHLLFTDKLVKLFKLLNGTVHVIIGKDAISGDIIQTKIKLSCDNVIITAILSCDDTMLNSVPASAIRARVENIYPYGVTISKARMIEAINRLLLFNAGFGTKQQLKSYSDFIFSKDCVTIFDVAGENNEQVYYNNESNITDDYSCKIDLNQLKLTLESCNDEFVTITFGDNTAIVLSRRNVYNVIPECH